LSGTLDGSMSLRFRDRNGNSVDVTDELTKLRASVDLLMRLSAIRVGQVNFDALQRLDTRRFDEVHKDYGGPHSGSWHQPQSFQPEREHYDTGIRLKLPSSLIMESDRWAFIDYLRVILASKPDSPYRTVAELIKAVVRSIPDHEIDAVSKVALLEVLLPEPKTDDLPETAVA